MDPANRNDERRSLIEYDGDGGASPDYTRAERYIWDDAEYATIEFYDAWSNGAGTVDRVYRYGLTLGDDGIADDARYDKLGAGGWVVESLFDDGAVRGSPDIDRAEAYDYDAAGRTTEIRFHDPYAGTFDLSGATPDKIHKWTYEYGGAFRAYDNLDRRVSFKEDGNNNGEYEYNATNTYHGNGRQLETFLVQWDLGSGGGTPDDETYDDGTIDWAKLESYDEQDRLKSIKYGNNGTWDVEDVFVWTDSVAQGPSMVMRKVGGIDDAAADFIYGTDGDDTIDKGTDAIADDTRAYWIKAGAGDDTITGGAGADVLILSRYNDTYANVVTDFTFREDRLWITTDAFLPGGLRVEFIQLTDGNQAMYWRIQEAHFPADGEPTIDAAVVTYGFHQSRGGVSSLGD